MRITKIAKMFLALVFIAVLVPVTAFAIAEAPTEGDGTAGNPYQISTSAHLEWVAQEVNNGKTGEDLSAAHFIMMNDITASGFWTVIGDFSDPFTGTFDGGNYKISNIDFDSRSVIGAGLFGVIGSGGTVKNLGVSGSVEAKDDVGGIAGRNSGTIINCYSEVNVEAHPTSPTNNTSVGGIVGDNANGGKVLNCYNIGTVEAVASTTPLMGGIVGNNFGTIDNCYSIGNIEDGTGNLHVSLTAGAVAGYPQGSISNSYHLKSSAILSWGAGSFGSISNIGEFESSTSEITDISYANSDIPTGNLLAALNAGMDTGYYTWKVESGVNGNYPVFDKEYDNSVTVDTASLLHGMLENTTAQTLKVTEDITLRMTSLNIDLGADHTLNIPTGKTVTLKGDGYLDIGAYTLTVNGGGKLILNREGGDTIYGTNGTLNLDDITVEITTQDITSIYSSGNGISVNGLNVNDGATIIINAPNSSKLLNIASGSTININNGGKINIQSYHHDAVFILGSLTVANGGTLNISANLEDKVGIAIYSGGALRLGSTATLTAEQDANISLAQGAIVEGVDSEFIDREVVVTYGSELVAGELDATASANALSQGYYFYNGTGFAKTVHTVTVTGGNAYSDYQSQGLSTISAMRGETVYLNYVSSQATTGQVFNKWTATPSVDFIPSASDTDASFTMIGADVSIGVDYEPPITTAAALEAALKDTTLVETIYVGANITLNNTSEITVGRDVSLQILDGYTVTLSGKGINIDNNDFSARGGKLVLNSTNADSIYGVKYSGVYFYNIEIEITTPKGTADVGAGGISAYDIELNQNVTITLNAPDSEKLLSGDVSVYQEAVIDIIDFTNSAIYIDNPDYKLYIGEHATVNVDVGSGTNYGIHTPELENRGTLTGTEGAIIRFDAGAEVNSVANTFSDNGHSFDTSSNFFNSVTVGAEDATPADNELSAGNYVYNGTLFMKGYTPTPPPSIFTVTFDVSGGEPLNSNTAQTNANGKLVSLPTPTRSGYTFAGWYTSNVGGEPIAEDKVYSSNTTIYAQWLGTSVVIPNASKGLDLSAGLPTEDKTWTAGNGTIKFDASENTLTLNNATIYEGNSIGEDNGAVTNGIALPNTDVEIILVGDNDISVVDGHAIDSKGNLTISGAGNITLTANGKFMTVNCITASQDLVITATGKTVANAVGSQGAYGLTAIGDITVTNANIFAVVVDKAILADNNVNLTNTALNLSTQKNVPITATNITVADMTVTEGATITAYGTLTIPSTTRTLRAIKGAQTPSVTSVSVSPATTILKVGDLWQFAALVEGTASPSQEVTWSVIGNTDANTAIDNMAILTVGADETATTLTVRATSVVDTTKSGTATVRVVSADADVYNLKLYDVNGSETHISNHIEDDVVTLNPGTYSGHKFEYWIEEDTIPYVIINDTVITMPDGNLEYRAIWTVDNTPPTPTPSGGGGGRTNVTDPPIGSTPVPTVETGEPKNLSETISTDDLQAAINKAITATSTSGEIIPQIANVETLTEANIEAIIKATEGKTGTLHADSLTNSGGYMGRIYLPLGTLGGGAGGASGGIGTFINNNNTYESNVKAQSVFSKYFANTVDVITLSQEGMFPVAVDMAFKVDLEGMDLNNLHFYSYDIATNTYIVIDTDYFIDINGFVHISTMYGNTIVVSSGPLALK